MIEVGEYARFRNGTISKVLGINKDSSFDLICEGFILSSEWVVKHSKNIKELIEENDIVTLLVDGEEILNCFVDKFDIKTKFKVISNDVKLLSILTKEKYKANCYKLERE